MGDDRVGEGGLEESTGNGSIFPLNFCGNASHFG